MSAPENRVDALQRAKKAPAGSKNDWISEALRETPLFEINDPHSIPRAVLHQQIPNFH
jgi:hypothetical protein